MPIIRNQNALLDAGHPQAIRLIVSRETLSSLIGQTLVSR